MISYNIRNIFQFLVFILIFHLGFPSGLCWRANQDVLTFHIFSRYVSVSWLLWLVPYLCHIGSQSRQGEAKPEALKPWVGSLSKAVIQSVSIRPTAKFLVDECGWMCDTLFGFGTGWEWRDCIKPRWLSQRSWHVHTYMSYKLEGCAETLLVDSFFFERGLLPAQQLTKENATHWAKGKIANNIRQCSLFHLLSLPKEKYLSIGY